MPSNFPQSEEHTEFSYVYKNFCDGAQAREGRWAHGPTPDGKGELSHDGAPQAGAPLPPPTHPDSRLYGTTELPNAVEKVTGKVQDVLHRE